MSVVKSSVLNLYDALAGDKHFQTKVSSDKVDLCISTLPITIKGTQVNITNEGGDSVQDVVQTTKDIQQSVVDETAARVAAVSAEATLRSDADTVLQTAINQEAVDRTAAIQAASLIRVAAEDALDVKITEEKAARQAAVNAEISARSAADTVLQTNLDAEATTRSEEDQKLQNNIDAEASARQAADQAELQARSAADAVLQSNLDTEENERKTADSTLQANIDQEVSDRQTAVDDEATARVAQDNVLQSNLDAEAKTRGDADVVLQTNIDTETANRITAVADEATARADADNQLSIQITAEQTARLAEVDTERKRIDSLLEGTSIDLNQLQELVTAYTTSDNNILAQIATINTNISTIQSQLDGTDATLNTLIANIEASALPTLVEIITSANALTDDSLLTSSSSPSAHPAWHMFNGVYGADVSGEYYGWYTGLVDKQALTIEGVSELGHYNYINLASISSTFVLKQFELWASHYFKPLDFYIIGSNDTSSWTKLYDSQEVNKLTTVVVGSANTQNKYNTGRISVANTTHYQYIGLFVLTSFTGTDLTPLTDGASCQELRMFG